MTAPFVALLLQALPAIFPFAKAIWEAIQGDTQEAENLAWKTLLEELPDEYRPLASTLEPYFRAVWANFTTIEKGWKWLTQHLEKGGLTAADVLPWEGVDAESHQEANAWLAAHVAAKGAPSGDPWGLGPEAITSVEVKHPGGGQS